MMMFYSFDCTLEIRGWPFLRWLAVLLASIGSVVLQSAPAYAGRDDVAVVIGNQDYSKSNTHNVEFAVNDARAIKAFLIDRLGYDEGGILYQENATLGSFKQLFGSPGKEDGKLWDYVRKGRSNVFVYYSGHGAIDVDTKEPYLIPTDIDPTRAAEGYPVTGLEQKLKELKVYLGDKVNVILILDACFSGRTGGGSFGNYSAGLVPNWSTPSPGIIRLSAAGPNEVANWDRSRGLGLFTAKLLEAVDGAADRNPFGDGNGRSTWAEIATYVSEEVNHAAKKQHARKQNPELPKESGPPWDFEAGETPRGRDLRLCREEPARWQELVAKADAEAILQAASSFQCRDVVAKAEAWLRQKEGVTAQGREAERQKEDAAAKLAELKLLEQKAQQALAAANAAKETFESAVKPPVPAERPDPACPRGSSQAYQVTGVAANDVLFMRTEPDHRSAYVYAIPPAGQSVTLYGDGDCQRRGSATWCHVVYACRHGWVNMRFLTPQQSGAANAPAGPDLVSVVGVAAGDRLWVRPAPADLSSKVGGLAPGTRGIERLDCQWVKGARWCRIKYGAVSGWVNAKFIN